MLTNIYMQTMMKMTKNKLDQGLLSYAGILFKEVNNEVYFHWTFPMTVLLFFALSNVWTPRSKFIAYKFGTVNFTQ